MKSHTDRSVALSRDKALRRALLCFGLFAIATGLGDVALGPRMLQVGGADLGLGSDDPVLDSQLRFLGAIWAGWGATLVWTSRDIATRRAPLTLLCGTLLLSGIGRVIAAIHDRSIGATLAAFIVVEFGLPFFVIFMARPAKLEAGVRTKK